MFRFIIIMLFVGCFSVAALDKQPDEIVKAYDVKLKKLTASFEKQAGKLKKDALLKLASLRRQLARKGDSDGAKAMEDLIKRLKMRTVTVGIAEEELFEDLGDDIAGVPPPPGENSPSPLTTEQLDAEGKRKVRRITKPKALHKALAALNPAYNMKAADFVVENGVIVKVVLSNAGIVNIAPLAGLKHVSIVNLDSNPIWNLKPLSKLHLVGLSLDNTDVRDLQPLKNMKLYWLNISGTKVSDLSPIKRLPLAIFYMSRCAFIKDITPLKRLKNLEELLLPFQATKNDDVTFLKKLKKLRYIDTNWHEKKQPAEEFWRKLGK